MPTFFYNGVPVQNTNMPYNGKVLPQDAVKNPPAAIDYSNYPSWVVFVNPGVEAITLPFDVMVYIEGEKIIAESQILDGVSVFEHIARRPFEITFECVVRDTDANGNQIFPQDKLDDIFTNIFMPNSVQTVQNTYLNKIGIQQLIVKSISPTTVRGSTNIPLKIRCYENVPGQSIIM